MVEAVIVLILATCAGFCSSAPLGAINLWITDLVMTGAEHRLRGFLVGVILADVTHALMALWGYHTVFGEGALSHLLALITGVFLIVLGVLSLKKRMSRIHPHYTPQLPPSSWGGWFKDLMLGLVMCLTNPGFLVFWLFVVDQVERVMQVTLTQAQLPFFVAGIGLGDGLWFLFLIYLARKGRTMLGAKSLEILRKAIAFLFILLGVFALGAFAYEGF